MDDGCEDDLVCDEDEETCREALTCEEIECLPHQRCAPGEEGADAWCPEECNPPYDWRDGGCFAEVPPSCLEDDENSILELCTEQHRECVDLPGGADCGDCLPGFRS